MPTRDYTGPIIVLTTVSAFLLRLWELGSQSLWIDEINTLQIIDPGWEGISTRGVALTSSPPLFYLLARVFYLLWPSEFGLRFFSAAIGALTIPFFYLFVKKFFDRKTATIASILLTVSPFHIWYSQDARPYSFLMFISLLSTIFLFQYMKEVTARSLTLYIASITIGLYIHLLMFLVVIFHFIFWIWHFRSSTRRLVSIPLAQAIAGLLFLPFLPLLAAGVQTAPGIPRDTSFLVIPYSFFAVISGFSIGPSTYSLHQFKFPNDIVSNGFTFAVFAIIFVPMFIFGFINLRKFRTNIDAIIFWIIISVTGLMFLSFVTHHTYNIRYVSHIIFPSMIIASSGILYSKFKGYRILAFSVVFLYQIVAVFNLHFVDEYKKSDFRKAGSFLEKNCREGDVIYLVGFGRTLSHYYDGQCDITVIPEGQHGVLFSDLVESSFRGVAERARRIWLVEGRWEQLDPDKLARSHLEAHFEYVRDLSIPSFARLMVDCYRVADPGTFNSSRSRVIADTDFKDPSG